MTKFVNFAEIKDAASFKDAFENAIAAKVNDALEAKKLEIAVNYFNGGVEIQEEEELTEEEIEAYLDTLSEEELVALAEEVEQIEEAKYLGSDHKPTTIHNAGVFTRTQAATQAKKHGGSAHPDRQSARGHVVKLGEELIDEAPLQVRAKKARDGVTRLGFRVQTADIISKNNARLAARKAKMQEDAEQIDEKLVGRQHKIDANHNGRLDAHDFKLLRARRKGN